MKMKAVQLLQKSKQELKKVCSNPHQESLWLLSSTLNCSPSEIYLERDNINKNQQKLFFDKIQRRKQGEALEYILKEFFFNEKQFYIEEGVFIPRQETEVLVQWVLKNVSGENLKAIDFGAGAGALCLSLLLNLKPSQFLALEICPKAIKCLKKNSSHFGVEKRLTVLKKDVSHIQKEDVIRCLGSAPSLIVANPPYIDPKDQSISRQTYFFDPPLALFSDKGGMGHIISWFEKAMEVLSPKGIYIFEFGWNQEKPVRAFCEQQKELVSYEIHKDDIAHPRVAVCFKKD